MKRIVLCSALLPLTPPLVGEIAGRGHRFDDQEVGMLPQWSLIHPYFARSG